MKQYLDILENVLNGTTKEPARENMPRTIGITGVVLKHDLSNGFPLLTTKEVSLKNIFNELIWFLSGDTNIKYLIDKGTNIWNQDAYRWYLKKCEYIDDIIHFKDIKEFVDYIRSTPRSEFDVYGDEEYEIGDLGKIYGYQWRNQMGWVDQVKNTISGLKTNPSSRYHIIDGWNPFEQSEMALPPCHLLYHFITRPFGNSYKLDLVMYQRSVDTFLGFPYNLASMSLFNILMAKIVGMEPGEITWVGGDVHIYENHLEQVKEQLGRKPKALPVLNIKKQINSFSDVLNMTYEDIELLNYEPAPRIKAPLSVGL